MVAAAVADPAVEAEPEPLLLPKVAVLRRAAAEPLAAHRPPKVEAAGRQQKPIPRPKAAGQQQAAVLAEKAAFPEQPSSGPRPRSSNPESRLWEPLAQVASPAAAELPAQLPAAERPQRHQRANSPAVPDWRDWAQKPPRSSAA